VLRTARELQFTTVAEGVETHIEWRFVREMGFDIAQGWKLGKPMPLSRFIEASSGPL
jgi:EAL domain-containing protein (putative c-di-GMP-specific phosphodiesterase class I)